MKRVLVCDRDGAGRMRMRAAVEAYAAGKRISNVEVALAASPEAFSSALARMRPGLVDLVVCCIDDEGALDALRAARARDDRMLMVVTSASDDAAMSAFELQAGFFRLPGTAGSFERVVGKRLDKIAAEQMSTMALRSAAGVSNIVLEDVLFAESARKGPIIHLPGSESVVARGTLSALADRFAQADPARFMKVGGSFIVNLDNIRSAGESSVIFANGEAIIVPVRMRKPLSEALTAYRSA